MFQQITNVSDCECCRACTWFTAEEEWDAHVVKSAHSLLQQGLTSLTDPCQCAFCVFAWLPVFVCVSVWDSNRQRQRCKNDLCVWMDISLSVCCAQVGRCHSFCSRSETIINCIYTFDIQPSYLGTELSQTLKIFECLTCLSSTFPPLSLK